MWVNLAQLVRQRVPDRKGGVLPLDVGSVTYDLHDLTPRGHNLIANELAVNNTFGSGVIPDCPECCSSGSPFFDPDSLDLFIGGTDPVAVDQVDSCNGVLENVTLDGTGWGSDDTAVATLSTGKAAGVGAGSTFGFVYEAVEVPGECACNKTLEKIQLPITVTQCPSSASLAGTTPIPLEDDFPTYKTGIGAVASIQVAGPASGSYNSSKVSEALSVNGVMQNTCTGHVNECQGSATFTVGTGGADYGVRFNAANNVFYDGHSLVSTSSVLSGTGLSSCTYSCNQTYHAVSDPAGNSCGNANIGSFTITYTLRTDTIQGTPVTRTTVMVQ